MSEAGKTVAIVVLDGVTQKELSPIKSELAKAGIKQIVVTTDDDIQMNFDYSLNEMSDEDLKKLCESIDAVVLLGGYRLYYITVGKKPPEKHLRKPLTCEDKLVKLLKECLDKGKIVATALAGPAFLAKHGLIKGKKATVLLLTNLIEMLKNNGVELVYDGVVEDGNLLTAKNFEDVPDLAKKLVEKLKK